MQQYEFNSTATPLWDVDGVAAFLRMSKSWVQKRAADGTLPTLRVGKSLRFEPEAIRAWVREQKAPRVVVPFTKDR